MEELKEKILAEGNAINKHILKVDSFINHQIDVNLMKKIGENFANKYREENITKVVTIESSGIAPATFTALLLGVPLIVLKKQTSKILNEDILQTTVKSFTKNSSYELTLSKKYINENDKVLIIDDFLANGEAAMGAISLIEKTLAKVIGVGIVIEKSFQPGREKLEKCGYNIYSLARVLKLSENKIEFIN